MIVASLLILTLTSSLPQLAMNQIKTTPNLERYLSDMHGITNRSRHLGISHSDGSQVDIKFIKGTRKAQIICRQSGILTIVRNRNKILNITSAMGQHHVVELMPEDLVLLIVPNTEASKEEIKKIINHQQTISDLHELVDTDNKMNQEEKNEIAAFLSSSMASFPPSSSPSASPSSHSFSQALILPSKGEDGELIWNGNEIFSKYIPTSQTEIQKEIKAKVMFKVMNLFFEQLKMTKDDLEEKKKKGATLESITSSLKTIKNIRKELTSLYRRASKLKEKHPNIDEPSSILVEISD